MKLRLRIGRQRAQPVDTGEVRVGGGHAYPVLEPQPVLSAEAAAAPQAAPAPATVPPARTPVRRVVRAGSFCRVGDIGQTAVTDTGRAVLAVRAGRCGRWVYDERG